VAVNLHSPLPGFSSCTSSYCLVFQPQAAMPLLLYWDIRNNTYRNTAMMRKRAAVLASARLDAHEVQLKHVEDTNAVCTMRELLAQARTKPHCYPRSVR
jgi:hypothetical protein